MKICFQPRGGLVFTSPQEPVSFTTHEINPAKYYTFKTTPLSPNLNTIICTSGVITDLCRGGERDFARLGTVMVWLSSWNGLPEEAG